MKFRKWLCEKAGFRATSYDGGYIKNGLPYHYKHLKQMPVEILTKAVFAINRECVNMSLFITIDHCNVEVQGTTIECREFSIGRGMDEQEALEAALKYIWENENVDSK